MFSRSIHWQWVIGLLVALALGVTGCIVSAGDVTGARAEGERLKRMQSSPQWHPERDRFTNELRRVDGSFVDTFGRFLFGGSPHREPSTDLAPLVAVPHLNDGHPASGLRVTWMGHSSFLVEIDGVRTLVDPIWSERASPFLWAGPKRFYPPPIALDALPAIDAVIISHDHYDHLDRDTVVALLDSVPCWLVPLGVGAHLERWGVPTQQIVELDWWETHHLGAVEVIATPSRHFSGRAVTFTDQDATLWAGWAWRGPTRRVFYSGDTALHPEFAEIGQRLGPFDLTLMDTGAYSQFWADVHLGPEQAVLAHRLVRGRIMIPVHWGLFNLALHGWTEPAERVREAAIKLGVTIAVLRPGTSFDIADRAHIDHWWPSQPWQNAQEAPVWSSAVEELQRPLRKQPGG